jgi:cytochrome c553
MAGLSVAVFFLAPASSMGDTHAVPGVSAALRAGERIYRQGVDIAENPVQGISQDDVPLSGEQAACVNCHRPSGLGSAEGGYYVPPINGQLLFAPRKLDRRRLFPDLFHQVQPERFKSRLYQPHMRPAYTLSSLATALRDGIDPTGQPLAAVMPRYRLTDGDVAALNTYLHALSAHTDPGVDDHQIQLATVFSSDVAPAEREAMLGTLRAYVDWHNLHLHEDLARGSFSPYNRSQFVPIERRWVLSVWELQGDESTWRAQLEAHYLKDPVFALISGMVQGSWSGPATFCDEHRLPCLFPDTELPAWPTHRYDYTVYFSAGLPLQAQVAARFIAQSSRAGQSVLQLAATDAFGQVPAREFEQTLRIRKPGMQIQTLNFLDSRQLKIELSSIGAAAKRVLVVWPGADVAAAMRVLEQVHPRAALIVLPDRAIQAASVAPMDPLAAQLRFVDPYELDMPSHAKSFETRAWMHARGLGSDHIVLRFKAYYAMNLLDAALFEISNDYYRDYLLERVEDESQKDMNPGMYPRLALSPGERFAAKIAEVVRLDAKRQGGLAPAGDWIAP